MIKRMVSLRQLFVLFHLDFCEPSTLYILFVSYYFIYLIVCLIVYVVVSLIVSLIFFVIFYLIVYLIICLIIYLISHLLIIILYLIMLCMICMCKKLVLKEIKFLIGEEYCSKPLNYTKTS